MANKRSNKLSKVQGNGAVVTTPSPMATNGHSDSEALNPNRVSGIPGQFDHVFSSLGKGGNLAAPVLEMAGDNTNWMAKTNLDEEEIQCFLGILGEDMAIDDGETDWTKMLHFYATLKKSEDGFALKQYERIAIAEQKRRNMSRRMGGMFNRMKNAGQQSQMDYGDE